MSDWKVSSDGEWRGTQDTGRSAGCYEREIGELRDQLAEANERFRACHEALTSVVAGRNALRKRERALREAAENASLLFVQIDDAETEDEAIDLAFGGRKAVDDEIRRALAVTGEEP